MTTIKPLGDRLLVKLRRDEEKKIGGTVITLSHSDKKRFQPESAVFLIMEVGPDVPDTLVRGDCVLARADAGVTLPPGTTNSENHRTYRLIEYPEVWSKIEEDSLIGSAEQVLQEKVVI